MTRAVGRPSKAEVQKNLAIESRIAREYEDDAARLQESCIISLVRWNYLLSMMGRTDLQSILSFSQGELMAWKNPEVDYAAELASVRKAYVGSAARQRLHIIEQRLAYKDSYPNNLVNAVSAVEGFARSLLIDRLVKDGQSRDEAYAKYRMDTPEHLVKALLTLDGIHDIGSYFGEDTWELLKFAVGFRNLIAHECTYVGQDKAPSMILACHDALVKLASIAGIKDYQPPF